MARSPLGVAQRDSVLVVTLRGTPPLNSFDDRLLAALADFWERDTGAGVPVVLTGRDRCFSSGSDATWLASLRDSAAQRDKAVHDTRRLFGGFLRYQGVIVAAVDGPAVGFGCTLATLADIIVLSETALLADPWLGPSISMEQSDAARTLLETALAEQAKDLAGGAIQSGVALSAGLANRVVPATELVPVAVKLAAELASSAAHVEATKRLVNPHLEEQLVTALDELLR